MFLHLSTLFKSIGKVFPCVKKDGHDARAGASSNVSLQVLKYM